MDPSDRTSPRRRAMGPICRSGVATLCALVLAACSCGVTDDEAGPGATLWRDPPAGVAAGAPEPDDRTAIRAEQASKRAEIRLLEQRLFRLRRQADGSGRVGRWMSPRVEGVNRTRHNAISRRIDRLESELRGR